jgi:hypothetical protein
MRNTLQRLNIFKIVLSGLVATVLVPFQISVSTAAAGTIWADTAPAAIQFAENVDTVTTVVFDSTTATLAGATTFTLSGSDASAFSVDADGNVFFVSSPDYETKNSYSLILGADDGTTDETVTLTLSITNVLWTPVTSSVTLAENIDTTTSIVFDSATATGATSFNLGGTDASAFSVDADGNVFFVSSPDYETKSSYSFELGAGNGTTDETVSVTVTISNVTSDDPAPTPAPAPVYIPTTPQAALTLTSSATTVEWGSQAKLTLSGGSGTGAVTYSSTGTTFCAVNPSGNLTPVSAGTCTVTATKDGDGTYGSAQSNSVTITAVDKLGVSATTGSTSNAGVAMVVGKPVAGVATVKFTVADTYAGEKVSVILATKNSAGKTIYKTLGSAKVGSTGAVSFKTKVKLPVGAVLQLKSAGSVILSKSIK